MDEREGMPSFYRGVSVSGSHAGSGLDGGGLNVPPGFSSESNVNVSPHGHGISNMRLGSIGSMYQMEHNPLPGFPHGFDKSGASGGVNGSSSGGGGEISVIAPSVSDLFAKKKRGRPRKYPEDGSHLPLALTPSSSSVGASPDTVTPTEKNNRGRPPGSGRKQRLADVGAFSLSVISGAFKFRGASNAIFSLSKEEAAKGVVTHSSGNHAAALSLAAKLRGIPAYIVIPKNAPKCKVENVKRYGGQIIWSEANMQSREETANKILHDTGAVLVHPYNDGRIISGQGTLSLEFLDQVPQLDTLIVPISGGGLISGVAIGAKSINPAIRVLAAEPKGADDAAQSKASGRIITLAQTDTIADGLRASLGDLTWPIVRDLIDDIITVEDKEIVEAMRYCYEILKVAIEPSGAIGLAAVLSDSFKRSPLWKDSHNIGIVLSGGNVDLGVLWQSLNS